MAKRRRVRIIPRMHIAHIAPEMVPFAKVGGLGDVIGALPRAQVGRGHRVSVVIPGYRWLLDDPQRRGAAAPKVAFHYAGRDIVGVVRSWEHEGVRVIALEQPELFDRAAVYGEGGQSYPDNGLRFGWFAGAALAALAAEDPVPDVVFAHDWPTALAPVFLRTHASVREPLGGAATVQAIHNLAHQGVYPLELARGFSIPEPYLGDAGVGSIGGLMNMLKGGILAATRVLTVSPTYAREILGPAYGEGLESVLAVREPELAGILNGIDVDAWNPATDPHLPRRYSLGDPSGKAECKAALQHELGLRERADLPLFGIVSRIDRQKGIDLIAEAAPRLVELEAQLVVLGTGVPGMLHSLHGLADIWKQSVAVVERFDEPLAHRIYAGSDFFLMPSRFEPCGLGQLVAMRYGTLPVVRRTGGLADTVTDLDTDPDRGTGFSFEDPIGLALQETCERAVHAFLHDGETLGSARRRAMAEDPSWDHSAAVYDRLIEEAVTAESQRAPS